MRTEGVPAIDLREDPGTVSPDGNARPPVWHDNTLLQDDMIDAGADEGVGQDDPSDTTPNDDHPEGMVIRESCWRGTC